MNLVGEKSAPRWAFFILWAAAIYNLLWGAWVIFRPDDLFQFSEIESPRYPGIWQCVGMIVGVYGIGYAIAAYDAYKHWPIVLVGLLGKIFGPIGFVSNLITTDTDAAGRLPLSWGATILTNDLIWWLPFSLLLFGAFRFHTRSAAYRSDHSVMTIAEANQQYVNQHGHTLADISHSAPSLLLFLRHAGCTFCREALDDLAKKKESLLEGGHRIVIVSQSEMNVFQETLRQYELDDCDAISDPTGELYRAYELGRGKISQLFGPMVWWRGFQAAILKGHGVGKLDGDGFQMPGLFLVHQNKLVRAFRHQTAADRPDVCEMAKPST